MGWAARWVQWRFALAVSDKIVRISDQGQLSALGIALPLPGAGTNAERVLVFTKASADFTDSENSYAGCEILQQIPLKTLS